MHIKEFCQKLTEFRHKHGNLPVFVLVGNQLFKPDIAHSEQDYSEDTFFGQCTWKDLGLDEPALIIDWLEDSQPQIKDEDDYENCQCDYCRPQEDVCASLLRDHDLSLITSLSNKQ